MHPSQAASSEQAAAWREAERGLQERLKSAEGTAAAAAAQAAQQGRELEEARQQLATATAQVSIFVGDCAVAGGRWQIAPGCCFPPRR